MRAQAPPQGQAPFTQVERDRLVPYSAGLSPMQSTGGNSMQQTESGIAETGTTQRAGAWRRLLLAPQTLWWRRALFQIHLWLGILGGIYVLLIALSGTALLLKSPFYTWFEPKTLVPLDS